MNQYFELASVITIATIISIIIKRFKQPLIIGYIVTGIIAGPTLLNILSSHDQMELFSKMGISVLLFIVGINLNPKVIKEVGKVSVSTGILQVIITCLVGFIITKLLGYDNLSSFYISISLTFGSTIIVLKLLSDKGDYHKLYGKLSIGFLLVQDIVASVILLIVSSGASTTNSSVYLLLAKAGILVISLILFNKLLLHKIIQNISNNPETLFIFSLAWGLGLASLFSIAGFSLEIGALIAGVSLSVTPISYEIAAKLKPIRDFFIVLFFIALGSQMNPQSFIPLLPKSLILSTFVIIGNPLIVYLILNLLGHKRKTAFMSGLTVSQISEFSLILATLGLSLGHINKDTLSLITLVGIITIASSSYLILYGEIIFSKIEWFLKIIELRKNNKKEINQNESFEILLFGFDRVGQDFVKSFRSIKKPFLVVDFNPKSIERLNKLNIPNRFGDAEDIDFLEEIGLTKIKLAISTIPDFQTNQFLTEIIKKASPKATIIIVSHDLKEAESLYELGASYVVVPHYLGAKHITNLIARLGVSHSAFKFEREKHLSYIKEKSLL